MYIQYSYKIIYKTNEHHETVKHYYQDEYYDSDLDEWIYGIKEYNVPIYDPATDEEITEYWDGTQNVPYETNDPILVQYYTYEDKTTYTNDPLNEIFYSFGSEAFNYQNVESNIMKAISNWTKICSLPGCTPNTQDVQNCCVKIKWVNTDDFTWRGLSPSTVQSFAHSEVSLNSCQLNCDSVFIELNQTKEYNGAPNDDLWDYKNFFTTGYTSKGDWLSLQRVLTHEIGHYLGFGDQNGYFSCDKNGSIMNYDYDFTTTSDVLFNDDDKCMYKKLYCWTPPPVEVEDGKIYEVGVEIFPNPTNTNLINLQFGNPSGVLMSFDIISPLGNIVLNGVIQPNENPKIITLDNLPAGIYFIKLNHDGRQETKKFVVDK